MPSSALRSEEHTSELQSLRHLVCRLLLEKTKIIAGLTASPAIPGLAGVHYDRRALERGVSVQPSDVPARRWQQRQPVKTNLFFQGEGPPQPPPLHPQGRLPRF